MAYKDLRGLLSHYAAPVEQDCVSLDWKIERVFSELALELGFGDVDIMPNSESPEEFTLVYDKFSARPR